MIILTYKPIQNFTAKHPEAKFPLDEWFVKCEAADWNNFHQMKRSFNSVDAIGDNRYIFNIGGNKYRLVAMIHFKVRTVYIKWVGMHSEYDKIDPLTVDN